MYEKIKTKGPLCICIQDRQGGGEVDFILTFSIYILIQLTQSRFSSVFVKAYTLTFDIYALYTYEYIKLGGRESTGKKH